MEGKFLQLQPLEVLCGTWMVEAKFQTMPSGIARATFEWGPGGAFMVQRVELLVDRSELPYDVAPDSMTVIMAASDGPGFVQHYFDSRGVARIYQMGLSDQSWTLTRTTADFTELIFAQRYVGRISADGQCIDGCWEKTGSDGEWETDFDLIYRRET